MSGSKKKSFKKNNVFFKKAKKRHQGFGIFLGAKGAAREKMAKISGKKRVEILLFQKNPSKIANLGWGGKKRDQK